MTIDIQNPIPQECVGTVPGVEQRGKVAFMKGDIVHDAIADYGKNITDGQLVMAKMMVDLKGVEDPGVLNTDQLKKRARPAGYAIGFAEEPKRQGEYLGRSLFDRGMMVFTSAVEHNGNTAFVGVDREGVFLIQAGSKIKNDIFLQLMRDQFDRVGDQEENFIVTTSTFDGSNARFWCSEYFAEESISVVPVGQELTPQLLRVVSEESLRAPLITSKDAELARKKFNQTGKETAPTPVRLSEIDF